MSSYLSSHPTRRPGAAQDGKLTNTARLTAGLGAGVAEALLIVTPFEVVKTRLQQQTGTNKALLKYRVRGREAGPGWFQKRLGGGGSGARGQPCRLAEGGNSGQLPAGRPAWRPLQHTGRCRRSSD